MNYPDRLILGGSPSVFLGLLLLCGSIFFAGAVTVRADLKRIEITGEPGLRFGVLRFAVEPGQQVELLFRNADEMQHNLIITAPGAREEVAALAAALGSEGPAREYVPETGQVLWYTPVLYHDQTYTLRFEAPSEEGVYPYVCTFPGHASLMYGAMYVTREELPPLAGDENVPEYARAEAGEEGRPTLGHHHGDDAREERPVEIRRTFVPEASPAAIAVHAGRNLSFVWDAATCHLRYAWRGGFVDSTRHWRGNGSAFSEIDGHIYYRAGRSFPIRIGTTAEVPERRFRGYHLVDGLPVFVFEIEGYEVRQRITALPDKTGLRMDFEMPDMDQTVFFEVNHNAGATFSSSAGKWNGATLTLEPEESRSFSVTLEERPGHEPIAYWPMDDTPWSQFGEDPVGDGVVGRALYLEREIVTPVSGADVRDGGTFSGWVRIEEEGRRGQVIFGGRSDEGEWALGYRYRGEGFTLTYPDRNGGIGTRVIEGAREPGEWNHFMVVFEPERLEVYLNGDRVIETAMDGIPGGMDFRIGGLDGSEKFRLHGWVDEFRVWSRVLEKPALMRLYALEASIGGISR